MGISQLGGREFVSFVPLRCLPSVTVKECRGPFPSAIVWSRDERIDGEELS